MLEPVQLPVVQAPDPEDGPLSVSASTLAPPTSPITPVDLQVSCVPVHWCLLCSFDPAEASGVVMTT